MALHQGGVFEVMKIASDNAVLQSDSYALVSGFTPINRPNPQQPPTPLSSASTSFAKLERRAARGEQGKKRHNRAVTEYLGLGDEMQPHRLDKYAPILPKKRGKNKKLEDDVRSAKLSKQRRVSDSLRSTKPASKQPHLGKDTTSSQGSVVSWDVMNLTSISQNSHMNAQDPPPCRATDPKTPRRLSHGEEKIYPDEPSVVAPDIDPRSSSNYIVNLPTVSSSDLGSSPRIDHTPDCYSSQDTITDDDIDAIFHMINPVSLTNSPTTNAQCQRYPKLSQPPNAEKDRHQYFPVIDTNIKDEDHFLMTQGLTENTNSPLQPLRVHQKPSETCSSNVLSSFIRTNSLYRSSSPATSSKSGSLITPKTHFLIQKAAASSNENQKPIVRSPFPTPVCNRSPIIGLSPNLLLRTCFRIGEAINQASHASKHRQNILFELYARVQSSKRDEAKQSFIFCDLFHDRPPYIAAIYDAVIWKPVRLYDYDGERLLEAQKMCRCMGTIRRDGKEWVMTVLNIWEAKSEDIAWVEGVVNSRDE